MTDALIHDAELFTVGPDEVVVTFRTDDAREVETTVGDRSVVTSGRFHSARVVGLSPVTDYPVAVSGAEPTERCPSEVTTLAQPAGRLLATVATVNDVHFGETECGLLGIPDELGPVFTSEPGAAPYPEVMNGAAVDAIERLDPDAVVVKGDLTDRGTEAEYVAFLRAYTRLGARMHHVRGNHDAMITESIAATGPFTVSLPGVTVAVLDTVRPGTDRGRVSVDQLEWLDQLAADTTDPVLVFGHHHPWDPASGDRSETYFGINPDDSDALCAVIERREAIAGYFAGHTHRTRDAAVRLGPGGPDRRDRVCEGLSGRVGRVPRLRRRVRAAHAADRRAGRAGVDGEDARDVRRAVPRLRVGRALRSVLRAVVLIRL